MFWRFMSFASVVLFDNAKSNGIKYQLMRNLAQSDKERKELNAELYSRISEVRTELNAKYHPNMIL